MKMSEIFDDLIYESKITPLIKNNEFFSIIREYYTMEGDYKTDAKNVNLLYDIIIENEDFNPFSHGSQDLADDVSDKICVLSMSKGNSKLDWPYLSLPAGYTCPLATVCKSTAAKPGKTFSDGSKLKAGPEMEYRCYAARQQSQYPNTRKNVFSNIKLLALAKKNGGIDGMAKLILDSLKYYGYDKTGVFRIHEGGDFYSDEYFKAWIQVCKSLPNVVFYTHTTSLNFWVKNMASIPSNMKLTASMDKNNEEFIKKHNLRYAKVVNTIDDAIKLKLHIDYDDTIAAFGDDSFALLLHGGQPKGSEAGKHVSKNKKTGAYDKLSKYHKANKSHRLKLANTLGSKK